MRLPFLVSGTLWLALATALTAQTPPPPEASAVAYLAKAVTSFGSAHDCRSCHANGDATRALVMAANRGYDMADVLERPLAFLKNPASWAANKGHDADEELMRLQFAAALAAAGERDLRPAEPLVEAAKIILADQMPDGTWVPDASDGPGSPLTWGTAVATWQARSTLIAAGREPDDFAVAAIDRWSRTVEVTSVTDAAGVVLALGVTSDVMADKQRAKYLNLLRFAQRDSGGWGAQPNADAATVFDTALVLIALQQLQTDPRLARSTYRAEELAEAITRGRAWLVAQQKPDGSWPETMRRSGASSEAQRLSTTAWALMALLGGPR